MPHTSPAGPRCSLSCRREAGHPFRAAAAATLTTRTRASLARIRDNYRRAALPGPRASVVNTNLTEAPSGSSAFCSPTSSAAFQRAQPLKSSSTPADQAAATTLSAFARAAPARTGYISQTAALPSCPRADQASNFKFTAAPKGRLCIQHSKRERRPLLEPPRLAHRASPSSGPPPSPSRPASSPLLFPRCAPASSLTPPSHTASPLSPSSHHDEARARRQPCGPPPLPPHHLQATYIRVLSDLFCRASLLPLAS